MAVQTGTQGSRAGDAGSWYSRSPDEVTTTLDVDPAVGLTAARAAELLSAALFNAAGEPFGPRRCCGSTSSSTPRSASRSASIKARAMARMPRPRGESVLTRSVMVTVGLAGLAITIGCCCSPAWDIISAAPESATRWRSRPRALPDRGRAGMPQRDRHRADDRQFRQQADELGDARGVRPGRAGHPDGCIPAPAGNSQLNLRQFAGHCLITRATWYVEPPAGSDSGTLELARCWRMDNQVRVSRQPGR